MPDELRRGVGVLRYTAGRDRRLLLRGLSGQEAGERGAFDGRQAERERGSNSSAVTGHQAKDVEGVPESTHLDGGFGILLRNRILHRRERAGERGRDRAVR